MRRDRVNGLAAAGAATLAVWGAASALASDQPPQLGAMAAAGQIHLASPQDGTAVLTAANLFPGDTAQGTVTLENTGDAAGDLQLDLTQIRDILGAGRGRLSGALVMRLDDITAGTPHGIYAGSVTAFDDLDLGKLGAGEQRTYRITALLPDHGIPSGPLDGDNALQGATTELDWTWKAQPIATPTPLPVIKTPTPHLQVKKPTPPPVSTPIPIKSRPGNVNAAASVLTLRIPWQRVMTTRGITVSASCDRKCRLSFTAIVQTAPRHGRARKLMRQQVFRVRGTKKRLRPGHAHRIKLHLTPRAVKRLHTTLLARGRAAVLVKARVKSSLGAATVTRRIVITTSNRAARHRAARKR